MGAQMLAARMQPAMDSWSPMPSPPVMGWRVRFRRGLVCPSLCSLPMGPHTHREFCFPRENIKEGARRKRRRMENTPGCLLGGVEPANFMRLLLVRVGSLLTCSWARFPAPRASNKESDSSLKARSSSTVCSPAPIPGGDPLGAAARGRQGLPAVCTHLLPCHLPLHQSGAGGCGQPRAGGLTPREHRPGVSLFAPNRRSITAGCLGASGCQHPGSALRPWAPYGKRQRRTPPDTPSGGHSVARPWPEGGVCRWVIGASAYPKGCSMLGSHLSALPSRPAGPRHPSAHPGTPRCPAAR